MAAPATVLFDLTPLDTQSRYRGHGRYICDLAAGLARLPARHLEGMRLVGLTHLRTDGRFQTTTDLASFTGTPGLTPRDMNHYAWSWRRRALLWWVCRRLGAAAVHMGDATGVPFLMPLSGCKRIVTCHDMTPSHWPERYFDLGGGGPIFGPMIEARRYWSADYVVAISDAVLEDAVTIAGVDRSRITRVYNGIDVDRWAAPLPPTARAVRERLALGARPFFLYVGDAGWHKNVEGIVGGVARARSLGHDVDLLWAGLLSTERAARIDALAREAGILPNVRRLGYVADDDLHVLYRECTAHVFVSRAEGFGMPLLEAMAAGAPTIASSIGPLREVGGDAPTFVDPEDHAAIGDAMARMLVDPELRRRSSVAGTTRARLFTCDHQARQMANVYRRVVGLPVVDES